MVSVIFVMTQIVFCSSVIVQIMSEVTMFISPFLTNYISILRVYGTGVNDVVRFFLLVIHFQTNYRTTTPVMYTRGHRGRDCMVVGFSTTYAISAYHH